MGVGSWQLRWSACHLPAVHGFQERVLGKRSSLRYLWQQPWWKSLGWSFLVTFICDKSKRCRWGGFIVALGQVVVRSYLYTHVQNRLPRWHSYKEPPYQCRICWRHRFDPWVRKIPWRRAWQPTPVFLPGESHGQRSLGSYSPWSPTELDMPEVT